MPDTTASHPRPFSVFLTTPAIVVVGWLVAVAGGHIVSIAWWWILWLNIAAWIPAFLLRSERFYDAVGSLTFLSTIAGLLWWQRPDLPTVILLMCAGIWSLRMAWFLVSRIRQRGSDGRFDRIKADPVRFLNAWAMQGLWAFLCLLPVLIHAVSGEPATFSPWWMAGVALWAAGFGIEVLADEQKRRFRIRQPDGTGFIQTGLWGWSRHPNYVGEILLWTGLTLATVPSMSGWGWIAWVTPVFVHVLLRFVSGVPLLEQRADARWSGNREYEEYKARTPVLFPWRS